MALLEGPNNLQGGAYDRDRTATGLSDEIEIIYKPARNEKPDLHVLCVGAATYKDRNLQLFAPKADAESVALLFQKTGQNLYKDVHLNLLTDDQADRETVEKVLQEIVDQAVSTSHS